MFYTPAFRRGGPFIMSSTSSPDDAKLRAVLNQFLAAIGLPPIEPDADLVSELQARVDALQANSGPSAPAPTAMASRLRKGTPVRTLADTHRMNREVAQRVAKARGITVQEAMAFIPQ